MAVPRGQHMQTALEKLKVTLSVGNYSDDIVFLNVYRHTPFSAPCAARKPLKPWVLVGTLHGKVHKDTGGSRSVKAVRVKKKDKTKKDEIKNLSDGIKRRLKGVGFSPTFGMTINELMGDQQKIEKEQRRKKKAKKEK
jgi:hypothetical protein